MKLTKKPLLDKEEDESEDETPSPIPASQIAIGDLIIISKNASLKTCKNMARELLTDKKISNYLSGFRKKKFFGSTLGVG